MEGLLGRGFDISEVYAIVNSGVDFQNSSNEDLRKFLDSRVEISEETCSGESVKEEIDRQA